MEEAEVVQTKKQPAITISVQSWATPIVGVVMLIIGLFGGYYGRPLLGNNGEPVTVPATIASAPTGGGNEEMMTYLVSQIRHFTGDANAPVTLIEFGDFQ